ncbi:RNA-binding protein [Haladaptatus litoreus]|uniref:RNA-binding protein n=1 Tax=Haladaptatus litoreus TaxID=553468 RepID=A0A1N6X3H1_9EURY|nr:MULTISPECIES: Gar1/Naf1 family protein [Haladaptatus]SIQ96863.1 RNA-binding protein [Haladaptatus litoreus]
MHRLGEVVRTAQNLAIVQSPSEDYPDIGTMVVDESLQTVGRVVDVFGPVSQPYVAVSPDEDTRLAMLVGSKLYAR